MSRAADALAKIRRHGNRMARLLSGRRRHLNVRGRHASVHLVIGRIESGQCSVVFEPYGAEHVLTGEDHLRLEIEVSDASAIEVAYSTECITLWLPLSVVSLRATNRIGDAIDLGLDIWLDSSSS